MGYFFTERPEKSHNESQDSNDEETAGSSQNRAPPLSMDLALDVASNVPSEWLPHRDNASIAGSRRSSVVFSRSPSTYSTQSSMAPSPEAVQELRGEVMANWLHSIQEEKRWTTNSPGEGVVLRRSKAANVCCPEELKYDGSNLYDAISALNVRCAMTVKTRVIKLLLSRTETTFFELHPGLRLQVIPDVESLPLCQKQQSAAFVTAEQLLVVWEDDPKRLLGRAQYIQDALVKMIWGNQSAYPGADDEKFGPKEPFMTIVEIDEDMMEALEGTEEKPRRIVMMQPVCTALTLALVVASLGAGFRKVAIEILIDSSWLRLAFLAAVIPQVWLALFFFQATIGNLAQIVGPIGQISENTKFFSGIAPRRLRRDAPGRGRLPHVTVQMPVYKEGLRAVIEPTIRSVRQAISTYEMQGGTANIFVNDDGMQLLSNEEFKERQDFYEEHGIGWIARPPHNPRPSKEGEVKFTRRGKFKKASNLNHALWTSVRVEEILGGAVRENAEGNWTRKDEAQLYEEAVKQCLAERNNMTWSDGNIRIGDYILLIDSDTRVPNDCLLEAVSEMEQSPQVAILQYSSGVMNVTNSFFENAITFFTNLVYTQIRYAVANGDVAPFVGHNAIIRWSAVQDVAYDCEVDHHEKYWSEETVSEDFDMALRLQTNGYLVRFGAYKGDGFKEGVSLTVYDELARWEKYAYGCNELIFHPIRYWLVRGPFTSLFIRFITSKMPFPSKITILAYIGTYYALASAWSLTLMNYFLVGWLNGSLDHYYIDSFKVYFSIVVVFTALGNISLAVLRYRIGEGNGILSNLWENFRWIPVFVIFLGGVSLHVSQALLCHMFSIDMTWGATAKEVEHITFFQEIPRVVKRFKFTFAFCIVLMAMMICMKIVPPPIWRIDHFVAIWPLSCVVMSHFLLPIVLNPNLMLFTW